MKAKSTIRVFFAWVLLATFISAFAIKTLHYHELGCRQTAKASTCHDTSIRQTCSICEFTMHQATEMKPMVFVPIITVTLLSRHLFAEQKVTLDVFSLNSHSPPALV